MSPDQSRAAVEQVKRATDIAAIISRRVQLKRTSSGFVGLCPFHQEKTPSFNVRTADGFFYCFGCKKSGDVFTWLEEMEGLGFREAFEQLAAAAGIELPHYTGGGVSPTQRERQRKLLEVTAAAASFYHERLLRSPDAQAARDYLKSRGIHSPVAKKYQLGYAPTSVDGVQRALDGYPAEHLAAAGLTRSYAGSGDTEDAFRDRLIIPIADRRGAVVAFGARVMPDGRGPKYLNSPATPIYDKSSVLFNLHQAIPAIRRRGDVIICEGYTDVIGFGMCELDNAVATCGTALTENHVRELSRHTKRVLLAFDADAAGETATSSVQRWEVAFDLEVAVVEMPVGADPGDLAVSDPERLVELVERARPLLDFLLHRLLASVKIGSPIERGHAADQVADLFAPYPSDLVATTDLQPAVDRLEVSIDDLRKRIAEARDKAKAQRRTAGGASRGVGALPSEPPSDAPPPEEPSLDHAYLDEDVTPPHSGATQSYDPADSGAYDDVGEQHSRRAPASAPGAEPPKNEVRTLRALIDFPDECRPLMVPEMFSSADLNAVILAAKNQPPIEKPAEAQDAVTTVLAAALDRELRQPPLRNGFDRCAPNATTEDDRKRDRGRATQFFRPWIDVLRRGESPDLEEQRDVALEVVQWFEDVAARQAEAAGDDAELAPPEVEQWRSDLLALVRP